MFSIYVIRVRRLKRVDAADAPAIAVVALQPSVADPSAAARHVDPSAAARLARSAIAVDAFSRCVEVLR
jgi:hypothetical protein